MPVPRTISEPLRLGDGMPDGSRPVAFLDRDGVIIEYNPEYVRTTDQVAMLPGSVAAVAELRANSFDVVIVTNQACVGKGLLTASEAIAVHQRVLSALGDAGPGQIVSFLCPHITKHGCPCRKPAAGMLRAALDGCGGAAPAGSFMVGDAETDLRAAELLPVPGHLVLTGRGCEQLALLASPGLAAGVHTDLSACVSAVLCAVGANSHQGD